MKTITRGDLLKTSAVAGLLFGAQPAAAGASGRRSSAAREVAGMNVLIYLTDQQRAIQHFPPGWAEAQPPRPGPAATNNGLTFENAFTNACMCSPARSTLMTGYFPAQHGVKYTLEVGHARAAVPAGGAAADSSKHRDRRGRRGLHAVYKGKWHCSKPHGKHVVPKDVNQYGFTRWNPQDAGANQNPDRGGRRHLANNDGRFMNDDGHVPGGGEGAPSLPELGRRRRASRSS